MNSQLSADVVKEITEEITNELSSELHDELEAVKPKVYAREAFQLVLITPIHFLKNFFILFATIITTMSLILLATVDVESARYLTELDINTLVEHKDNFLWLLFIMATCGITTLSCIRVANWRSRVGTRMAANAKKKDDIQHQVELILEVITRLERKNLQRIEH